VSLAKTIAELRELLGDWPSCPTAGAAAPELVAPAQAAAELISPPGCASLPQVQTDPPALRELAAPSTPGSRWSLTPLFISGMVGEIVVVQPDAGRRKLWLAPNASVPIWPFRGIGNLPSQVGLTIPGGSPQQWYWSRDGWLTTAGWYMDATAVNMAWIIYQEW
jgi:hypothetical protein